MAGGYYAKPASDSIGSEEAALSATWTDTQFNGLTATRAVALVSRARLIYVDSRVDTAASELDSHETPSTVTWVRRVPRLSIAREI